MRQVLMHDLVGTARALLAVPEPQRAALLSRILARALTADKLRKRTGRPHPLWGNGSLSDALPMGRKPPEPFLSDPEYIDVLCLILHRLRAKYPHTQRRD